jgi:hypothetical protein
MYHQNQMRRAASLIIVLLFGFGPLTGLLQSSDDARLPACCRRHGAHNCAMAMQMAAMLAQQASGKTPILTAPLTCPMFPGFLAGPSTPTHALASSAPGLPALLVQSRTTAPASAGALTGSLRTPAARGPPASIQI